MRQSDKNIACILVQFRLLVARNGSPPLGGSLPQYGAPETHTSMNLVRCNQSLYKEVDKLSFRLA